MLQSCWLKCWFGHLSYNWWCTSSFCNTETPESSCYAILWTNPEKTNRGIGHMKFIGGYQRNSDQEKGWPRKNNVEFPKDLTQFRGITRSGA